MRKLKAFLILLFAATLSLTLFACGGGEEEEEDGGSSPITQVQCATALRLTDSDDEAAYTTALKNYSITVVNQLGQTSTIKADAEVCDIADDAVVLHEVGTYKVTVTPKANNEGKVSGTFSVIIDHDWGAEENDVSICQYANCGAKRTGSEEDVAIHYGGFHAGTGATVPAGVELTEEDDGGFAEVRSNNVFNSDAHGDGDTTKSSGRIAPFGNDVSYVNAREHVHGAEVPTLTAGRLEKGMSITIEGLARTDAGEDGPWKTKNENWNAPSYGIADRNRQIVGSSYTGGVSVIIRSEGWVLQNGIGDTPYYRTLAGLTNGSADTTNYGSHPSDTGTVYPAGYTKGNIPSPSDDEHWGQWVVYSEGTDLHSADSYGSYTDVSVTWTYRQDGIIELVSEYDNTTGRGTTLTSYIKVPDPVNGYYDTIVHGDYSSLIITHSYYVETVTTDDVRLNGLKSGQDGNYLAGKQINASSVIDMEWHGEQTNKWTPYTVENTELYYYNESADVATVKNNVNDNTKWTAVGESVLTGAMKYFKVEFVRSEQTWTKLLLDAEDKSYINVIENVVSAALGYDYDTTLTNNRKVGSIDPAATEGADHEKMVELHLASGYLQELPEEHGFASLSETTDYRYLALKLVKTEAGEWGTVSSATIANADNAVSDTPYIKATTDAEGNVLVAIAIKETSLAKGVIISGIQDTKIALTFGNVGGYDVASTAAATSELKLNKGGEVTVTYTLKQGAEIGWIYVGCGSDSDMVAVGDLAALSQPYGLLHDSIKIKSYSTVGQKVTLTLEVGAYLFGQSDMPYVEAQTSLFQSLARDYIPYSFAFDNTTGTHTTDNGLYVYAEHSTSVNNLYFVKAVPAANGKIDLTADALKVDSLTLNVNSGSVETAKSLKLGYKYDGAAFVFNTPQPNGVTISYNAYGTPGIDYDYDQGVIIVIKVDMKALGGYTDKYLCQVMGEEDYWSVEGGVITAETISATEKVIVEAGDCRKTGIVAVQVKDGDDVVFLADYEIIGGAHNFGSDGYCTLCGAHKEWEHELLKGQWFDGPDGATNPNKHPSTSIEEGETVEFTGTYKNNISEAGFGSTVSVFVEERKSKWSGDEVGLHENNTYMSTQDGYVYITPFSNWGGGVGPYAEDEDDEPIVGFEDGIEDLYSSLITEDHPYNTGSGWVNENGEEITATSFDAAKKGGSFRFVVTHHGSYLRTDVELYAPGVGYTGTPFFKYYSTLQTETGATYTVKMFFKQQENNVGELQGNLIMNKSAATSSILTGAEAAQANGKTGSANINYSKGTGDEVTLNGMASKDNSGSFYAAFKVTFSDVLASDTVAELYKGETKVDGAVLKLADDKKSVTVYLPLQEGENKGDYTLKLTNYSAYTRQGDVTLHVDVLASNVSGTIGSLTNGKISVTGGTFTIEYNIGSADVANYAVKVGDGTAKKFTELANASSAAVDLGSGISVTGYATDESKTTLTFKYAGLTDYGTLAEAALHISVVPAADGAEVAYNEIYPILAGGQDIESSGIYAVAKEGKLYLYTNKGHKDTWYFVVNAGSATAASTLGAYNLGWTEAGKFTYSDNLLTEHAQIISATLGGETLTAIVLDLASITDLHIEASTAYGFMVEGGEHIYTVAADRQITQANASSAAKEEIQDATDCTTDEIKGYKSDNFYYGIEVTPAHHTFDGEGGKCSKCNEVSGWFVDNVKVGKSDNSVAFPGEEMVGGDEKAYNPAEGQKNSSIVKGQKITAKGVVTSSGANSFNGIAILFYPGVAFSEYPAMHIRGDAWINGLANRTGGTDTKSHLKYAIDAKINTTEAYDDAKYIAIAKRAKATIVWDWTDETKVVITYTLEGIESAGSYVLTVTITPEGTAWAATRYSIGIAPDSGSFTGTIECVCDKEFENPNPEKTTEVHTHGNWDGQDRCPVDGELNPEHEHSFEEGVCKCGAKQNEVTVGGQAYTSDMELVYGFKNNDVDGTWWNGNTDNVRLDNGNNIVVITASKTDPATHDLNFCDLCPEITEEGTTRAFTANIQEFTTTGDRDNEIWYFANDVDGNAWSAKTVSEVTGTKPVVGEGSNAGWKGDYKITFIRLGTSLTIIFEFTATGSQEVTYSATVTVTIGTTAVLAHIAGSPVFAGNWQAWSGTLTQKDGG